MTREEAKEVFLNRGFIDGIYNGDKWREAYIVISKWLEQEPKTGHWVEEKINVGGRRVFCSECGSAPPFEYVSDGDVYSASGYGVINKTKYCPNCGARMVEPQERSEKE